MCKLTLLCISILICCWATKDETVKSSNTHKSSSKDDNAEYFRAFLHKAPKLAFFNIGGYSIPIWPEDKEKSSGSSKPDTPSASEESKETAKVEKAETSKTEKSILQKVRKPRRVSTSLLKEAIIKNALSKPAMRRLDRFRDKAVELGNPELANRLWDRLYRLPPAEWEKTEVWMEYEMLVQVDAVRAWCTENEMPENGLSEFIFHLLNLNVKFDSPARQMVFDAKTPKSKLAFAECMFSDFADSMEIGTSFAHDGQHVKNLPIVGYSSADIQKYFDKSRLAKYRLRCL